MRLLLLGATGRTGASLLDQAVAAGHDVTVIARRPGSVGAAGSGQVTVIAGDVLAPGPWTAVAAEHDVLLSCLGSTDRKNPTTIYSEGTLRALAAMGGGTERRLICLSSAGLYVAPETPIAQKLVTRLVIQRLYRHGYDDMRRMEAALREEDARWTVIRPPMLSDKPATGEYRSAPDRHLSDPRPIARADLAHYMLDAIDDRSTWKSVVEISG